MLESSQNIRLDISVSPQPAFITLHQYDIHSRFVYVTVTDHGRAVHLPSTVHAFLKYGRKDGTFALTDCDIIDNVVIVEMTEQMLFVDGAAECEVVLYEGAHDDEGIVDGTAYASQHFTVIIDDSVHDGTHITSTDEYSALIHALIKAEALAKLTGEAREAVDRANITIDSVIERFTVIVSEHETMLARGEEVIERCEAAILRCDQAVSDVTAAGESFAEAEQKRVEAEEARTASESERNLRVDLALERVNQAAADAESIVNKTGILLTSDKGIPGGVAELDAAGRVPLSQMPEALDPDALDSVPRIIRSESEPEVIRLGDFWQQLLMEV
ncbi:BppU family phage baseplate upper protein [Anaerolentibacter hominis]|uniref:BppU family phage baseplate upper protein n=1 Tax=Anaerolentibacter hominis TaxID=3079009 RepID=UPI0031B80B61